jgi:hypothetical protein
VDYNALVTNPQPWVAAIRDFLGLPVDVERMIAAINPKLYRNRI